MGEEQKNQQGGARTYDGPERRSGPGEVRLTDATIDYLEEKMTNAVREGLRATLNEETARMFWGAGVDMLHKQAREQAGRFVIGSLAALARRVFVFLVLGAFIYAIGGWSALTSLAKGIFVASGAGEQ